MRVNGPVRISHYGLEYDREFMIVDANGKFLSQRTKPQMASILTHLESEVLFIYVPGGEIIQIPLFLREGELHRVEIWGDVHHALDQGNETANIISSFLGCTSRLVRFNVSDTRLRYSDTVGTSLPVKFADAYAIHLTSEESLDDLNARLAVPVPMERFRPNIVVRGTSPYAEESWKEIRINGLALVGATRCKRCTVIAHDQNSGHFMKEPLATLGRYKKEGDSVYFGRNFFPTDDGALSEGDEVIVY